MPTGLMVGRNSELVGGLFCFVAHPLSDRLHRTSRCQMALTMHLSLSQIPGHMHPKKTPAKHFQMGSQAGKAVPVCEVRSTRAPR
jgi:hypothetical protein